MSVLLQVKIARRRAMNKLIVHTNMYIYVKAFQKYAFNECFFLQHVFFFNAN